MRTAFLLLALGPLLLAQDKPPVELFRDGESLEKTVLVEQRPAAATTR